MGMKREKSYHLSGLFLKSSYTGALLMACAMSLHAGIIPEQTYSWTGGLGKWYNNSRWFSQGSTGWIPDASTAAVHIGENNNGNVSIDFGNWFTCGAMRIEAGSVLNVPNGQLTISGPTSGDYINQAGSIRGEGELILQQGQAFQSAQLVFEGDSGVLKGDNDGYLSGGTITLSQPNPPANFELCMVRSNTAILTNDDWLIRGNGVLDLPIKQGANACIRADQQGKKLTVNQQILGNLGIMEADGGILDFALPSASWLNEIEQWRAESPMASGTIRTRNNGQVRLHGRRVESGSLENVKVGSNAAATFQVLGDTAWIGSSTLPLTTRGKIDLIDEEETLGNPSPIALRVNVIGDIVNEGEIRVAAAANNSSGPSYFRMTDGFFNEASSFSGGGKITFDLPEGASSRFLIEAPYSYSASAVNLDHTWDFLNDAAISGSIYNGSDGVIRIKGLGNILSSEGLYPFVNQGGTISVEQGAILRLWRSAHFLNPNGFDNRAGTIQIQGDNSPTTSRVDFASGGNYSYMLGGTVNNQGGRFLVGGMSGDSIFYPSGWSVQRSFVDVAFTGSSSFGVAEFEAGATHELFNCSFDGTAYIRGGMVLTSNVWNTSTQEETFLRGSGTLVLSDGEWDGVTYPAEIHAQPYGAWTATNSLTTSCKIRGKGKIRSKMLRFVGSGGLIIDGVQNDIQLVDCQDITGSGSLQVINGGKLRIDASPLGMKLPAGLTHTVSQNGQLVIGGSYDVTVGSLTSLLANDGGSLLANDGASLLANDGGGIVAAGGGNIVASGGGNIVASGGGNIVASGGGNIVASGGGNIVSGGAGNIAALLGGNIVAGGAGNLLAENGGRIVASGGGNIVASGGGNIVASGGGNIVAGGAGNILSSGGGNIVASGGGNIVASGGGNIVASGGGNIVASGGGNLIAASGSSMQARLSLASRGPRNSSAPAIIVESDGALAPSQTIQGETPAQGVSGIAALDGDFAVQVGGRLQCEIGGVTAGSGFDQTNVAGDVDFAGILDVRLIQGFVTSILPTNSFVVLSCTGSLTGLPQNIVAGRVSTSDGIGSFRFMVQGESFVLDDFQITPGLAQTFAAYASAENLSGNPEDDADHDGMTDFAEYAFGTNPQLADAPPMAVIEPINEVPHLVLRYRVSVARAAAGLVLVPEASSTLNQWQSHSVVDTVDALAPVLPGSEARIARYPATSVRAFMRLRAYTP